MVFEERNGRDWRDVFVGLGVCSLKAEKHREISRSSENDTDEAFHTFDHHQISYQSLAMSFRAFSSNLNPISPFRHYEAQQSSLEPVLVSSIPI
jgi:hypothetical protein